MIALPGVFAIGQRLRKIMFPFSGDSVTSEIATVVTNVLNGVREVKVFVERHQIESLAIGAQRLRWRT